MSEVTWTEEELKEFLRLVNMASSQRQMDRIHSRVEMPKFVKEHGKEKCDAMFYYLKEINFKC